MLWKIDTLLFTITLSCLFPAKKHLEPNLNPIGLEIINYNITFGFLAFTKKDVKLLTCYFEDGNCIFCSEGLLDHEIKCMLYCYSSWEGGCVVGESCLRVWLLNRQGKVLWQYPIESLRPHKKWIPHKKGIITRQPFRRDGSLNILIKDTITKELKLLTLIGTCTQWSKKVLSLPFIQCKQESLVTHSTMFIDTLSEEDRLYIKPGFCDSLYVYEPSTGVIQRFWIFHSYRLIMVDSHFVYGLYEDYWGVFETRKKRWRERKRKKVRRYVMVHDKRTGSFLGVIPIPKHWDFIGYNWYEGAIYFIHRREKYTSSPCMQVYRLSVLPQSKK